MDIEEEKAKTNICNLDCLYLVLVFLYWIFVLAEISGNIYMAVEHNTKCYGALTALSMIASGGFLCLIGIVGSGYGITLLKTLWLRELPLIKGKWYLLVYSGMMSKAVAIVVGYTLVLTASENSSNDSHICHAGVLRTYITIQYSYYIILSVLAASYLLSKDIINCIGLYMS